MIPTRKLIGTAHIILLPKMATMYSVSKPTQDSPLCLQNLKTAFVQQDIGCGVALRWKTLTQDAEPIVEGDNEDLAEGGEHPGVVEVGGAPPPRLTVHEHHHSQA